MMDEKQKQPETWSEYIEQEMAKHAGKIYNEDNDDYPMMCEVKNCNGYYVGLYWQTNELRYDVEELVMQCSVCRDQIEI
jgi:hypothetical protein